MNKVMFLYKTELRKVLSKKSVWIAMAISVCFVLLVGISNLSADGHRAYVKAQENVLTSLTGTKMDEAFFHEFRSEIEKEVKDHPETYDRIGAYDQGAVWQNAANAIGKNALYDLIYNVVRDRDSVAGVSEDIFYESMKNDMIKDGREMGASDEEIEKWMSVYDGVEKPMSYSYALAYQNILDVLFIIGWALILNMSIALSGVFADEKTYRTDAMILSTKNGRTPICIAKILSSFTVAVLETAVLFGLCFGVMFFFYGTCGWNAMIQNIIPSSPWNITIGSMVLIYLGLGILVSIFFATTNMLLSHLTKSAVVTMAIHAAIIFAGLFNMPTKMGLISKLWQLRPTMPLYYGTFCNFFRYGSLNNVQMSVLIYGFCGLIFAVCLILSYKKSQVESR